MCRGGVLSRGLVAVAVVVELDVLRGAQAEESGVTEGSTSMMLAKRRSAWWKASWR